MPHKRLVQGLDMTAVYEIPTERWGKFTFSGGYNHFFTWKAEPLEVRGRTTSWELLTPGTFPARPWRDSLEQRISARGMGMERLRFRCHG